MRDRERFIRILGVAGLLVTAAGLLLAMGIAAGTLVFKTYEGVSARPGHDARDTASERAYGSHSP